MAASSAESRGADSEGSTLSKGSRFFSESMDELRKVNAPSRQETIQATLVTLFIMIFMALCLFLVDQVFNSIMSSLLGAR